MFLKRLLSSRFYFTNGFGGINQQRQISTELTTALRPFYFAVHPDLFGQHPEQRQVNEQSLKQLNAHIQSFYERKFQSLHNKTLEFYIRVGRTDKRDQFKLIRITLNQNDPKSVILKLLQLCNLPTDYIKTVKITPPPATDINWQNEASNYRPGQDYSYGKDFTDFETKFNQAKEDVKKGLDAWLNENRSVAMERADGISSLKEEVKKLQISVVKRLGLLDARYDCGWNYEHYRGCLKTLERLANLHANHVHLLKNRIVVFAPFTGISLEGHVMLFTGDVLNSWIDFIKNIPAHDEFLKKVPIYENTLSQVLRNIRIGRRKFMPKQQAREYAGYLLNVTTTVGDYLTLNKFPKTWPDTLQDYEIVIESEAGPLMVSPTGQLITPATCPGFMLVDFLTNNFDAAKQLMNQYKEQKHIEKELVKRCQDQLQLKSLTKDDSVTPDKMIETLTKLETHDKKFFQGIDLHITNYYSVLSDGIVCIPWDFATKN